MTFFLVSMGRLIYLSLRPDIAYAVNQFMHTLTGSHLEVAYKILKCLKGCLEKGLLYVKTGHLLAETYRDADWDGSVID